MDTSDVQSRRALDLPVMGLPALDRPVLDLRGVNHPIVAFPAMDFRRPYRARVLRPASPWG